MARVSAAVAANGVLRDTRCDDASASPPTDRFLSGDDAHLLGGYMRDVVLSGTGRVLRNHPGRIAGKTGTAQLDGRPSHGWFVGFAPFGPAARRIAFAVVIENAGYGGSSAAPAAGEIVDAATRAGLLR
jgi:cell division protein FtsI/penicillin-binding protein 2